MSASINADEIRGMARGNWLNIITGIDDRFSQAVEAIGKHVPCPIGTGSVDGFRFEESSINDGHAFSNTGAKLGNGFELLMWSNGWSFRQALEAVHNQLGSPTTKCTTSTPTISTPPTPPAPNKNPEVIKKNTIPIKIWKRSAEEISDPVKKYFEKRGLAEALPLPKSLRSHAGIEYSEGAGKERVVSGVYPGLIGEILKNGKIVGVQRHYLTNDGEKADVKTPKMMLAIQRGACSGGAVHLGEPKTELAITEGVENGLAVQLATGIPTWSATTGILLSKMIVPEGVKTVYIFADKDQSGAGEESAAKLRERLIKNNINTFILMPPIPRQENEKGVDWLDVLNKQGKEPFNIATKETEKTSQENTLIPGTKRTAPEHQAHTPVSIAKENLEKQIEEINKTHCFVTIGSKSAVMREVVDHDTGSKKFDILQVSAFRELFNNQTAIIGYTESGRPKHEKIGTLWMSHPNRRTYSEGTYFLPMAKPLKDGSYQKYKNKLNMWRGFSIKPIEHTEDSIEAINEHLLENLCAGDNSAYEYLINWMAFGVQHPEKVCGVAVVLRGLKGRGKGLLGSMLAKIYGQYSNHLTSSRHLTGNFNAHLENMCYIFADEAMFHGDTAGNNRLKALVTESTITIERKGFDTLRVKNHLKILMASNSDWVVPSSKDERRWFVLDLNDTKHSIKYYDDLHKATQDKKNVAQYLDFLLKRDLTEFNVRAYPETEGNRMQKMHSLEVIPRFLLDTCERGFIAESRNTFDPSEWHEKVSATLIMEGLNEWGKTNFKNNYERPTKMQLTSYLNKLGFTSCPHRDLWCFSNGRPTQKTTVTRGYRIGEKEELIERIMDYEDINPITSQK